MRQVSSENSGIESGSLLAAKSIEISKDGARPKIPSPLYFQYFLLEQLVEILVLFSSIRKVPLFFKGESDVATANGMR